MPDSARIERLCKVYQARDGTEVEALSEVSFTVGRREFVSIAGQSGCGKSTLLKIPAGLLPTISLALYRMVILAEKFMLPWYRRERSE